MLKAKPNGCMQCGADWPLVAGRSQRGHKMVSTAPPAGRLNTSISTVVSHSDFWPEMRCNLDDCHFHIMSLILIVIAEFLSMFQRGEF